MGFECHHLRVCTIYRKEEPDATDDANDGCRFGGVEESASDCGLIASLSGPNSHRFKELKRGSTTPFYGFSIPTSNTTYCPNQFFDICLPHHSRGVVRLVGYMIRKTLGWCDANGNPQRERFAISYNELEKEGGVGRDSIKRAIDEAVRSKFINCLQ